MIRVALKVALVYVFVITCLGVFWSSCCCPLVFAMSFFLFYHARVFLISLSHAFAKIILR